MSRMRMVKPGFFTNDVLAEVPMAGRLIFIGLWCLADREGRLEDRPKRIKAEVMPYDDVDVDGLLTTLAQNGFIIRYASGEHRYIQVVNFSKHQSPHIKENASTIPAPCKPGASTIPTPPYTDTDTDTDRADSPLPTGGDEHTETIAMGANAPSRAQAHTPITPSKKGPSHSSTVSTAATISTSAVPTVRAAPAAAPSLGTSSRDSPAAQPRVNPIWDALVDALTYEPATKSERSNWGKVVRSLKEVNATPQEIRLRAERYTRKYGRERLTINALEAHWSEFATEPAMAATGTHGPRLITTRHARAAPPVEPPQFATVDEFNPWKR